MPDRFLHAVSGGDRHWYNEATRAKHGPGGELITNHQPLPPDPDIRQAISTSLGSSPTIDSPALPPSEAWSRIYRPGAPPLHDRHREARDDMVHAARGLFVRLQDVFRYVEPTSSNFATYGHETRDLLILACNEVESGWRAVLRENGYERRDGRGAVVDPKRWNAENDYLKCRDALRLDEWVVKVVGRSRIGLVQPFAGWAPSNPLSWYQAYNHVKHDREQNFAEATLRTCIDACAAVAIMIWAQFGSWTINRAFDPLYILQYSSPTESNVVDTFYLQTEPTWAVRDYYAPPQLLGRTDADWAFTPYPWPL